VIPTLPYDGCHGLNTKKFSPGLQTDWLMAEQVHPAHLEPYGPDGPHARPIGFSGEGRRGFHHGSEQLDRFNKKPHTLAQTASPSKICLQSGDGPYILAHYW
jgi:hypothetical protein